MVLQRFCSVFVGRHSRMSFKITAEEGRSREVEFRHDLFDCHIGIFQQHHRLLDEEFWIHSLGVLPEAVLTAMDRYLGVSPIFSA